VIVGRFFYLQILKYDFYKGLSENNRIAIIPNVPNRGLILDRNGIILADNYFAYSLEITPSKVTSLNRTINELNLVVELSSRDLKQFRKVLKESSSLDSIPIKSQLSETEAARFSANKLRFEGVEIKSRLFRHYPKGAFASHLIGHINRINEEDKDVIKKLGLQQNYKEALTLFEHLLANCKPDQDALNKMIANEKKKRSDSKLNKNYIRSGLRYYAQFGPKNPFNKSFASRDAFHLNN
jgi:penicillin-binding protein 2